MRDAVIDHGVINADLADIAHTGGNALFGVGFNNAFYLGTNSKQKNKRRIEIEEAKKAYQ